ncbi:MAG: GTP cyclohydrolase FolE2 [Pseudomonadota bacterium]
MNAILPDVSITENAPYFHPLKWVGMQGIDLPVSVVEPGYKRELSARADLQVDLPVPHVKGIHMSRLYRLLDGGLGAGEVLAPSSIQMLLKGMIDTHEGCGTKSARFKMRFDLLLRRSALITEGLAGWKSYPVSIEATQTGNAFDLQVEVTVKYSSTCPCSAALSRQLVQEAFLKEFKEINSIEAGKISSWIRENATLATPHSQRSEAKVTVAIEDSTSKDLGLIKLIDSVESAVATPVQTAVKRADEQAFAALNGENLMFVEDAARRIEASLKPFRNPQVYVRHLESLHPHDAVAWLDPVEES